MSKYFIQINENERGLYDFLIEFINEEEIEPYLISFNSILLLLSFYTSNIVETNAGATIGRVILLKILNLEAFKIVAASSRFASMFLKIPPIIT